MATHEASPSPRAHLSTRSRGPQLPAFLRPRLLASAFSPPAAFTAFTVDIRVNPAHAEVLVRAVTPPGRGTASVYTGQETQLAGVFMRIEEARPVDGVFVLVTDGVQSTDGENRDRGNLASRLQELCGRGSDALCVREALLQLVTKRRWSAAVVAVKSAFQGALFSEVLRARGLRSRLDIAPSSRPFLVVVISPKRAQILQFLKDFEVKMERFQTSYRVLPMLSPVVEDVYPVDEAALSPTVSPAPDLEVCGRADSVLSLAVRAGVDGPLDLDIEVPSPRWLRGPWKDDFRNRLISSVEPSSLTASDQRSACIEDCSTLSVRAVGEALVSAPVSPGASVGAAGGPSVQFQPLDHLPLRFMPGGTRDRWQAFEIVRRLNPNVPPLWLKEWSTDDDSTPATAGQIYKLDQLLWGLWRNRCASVEDCTVQRLQILIGPRC